MTLAERIAAETGPRKLPKAELHCHVEGTASPALAAVMAERRGVDPSGLVAGGRYRWNDFSSFLSAYDEVAALFTQEDDYRRLAADYLIRLAGEGALYAELFVSPDHARESGLSPDAYLAGLTEGAREAEAKTGIVTRFIVVAIRHLGRETAEAAARLAAEAAATYPVVGFGLAGDERMRRPRDFARAFDIAREGGLGLTAHAGEFGGPDGIRETLDALKVSRLGHGVRAVEDPALVRRLAEEGVVLEVCPGSNLALGLYPDAKSHPLRALHQAGVRVTVSSDDPPFFDTTLSDEYDIARAQGFSDAELVGLTRTAIEAAFCDEETRRRCLGRLALGAISLGAPGASD